MKKLFRVVVFIFIAGAAAFADTPQIQVQVGSREIGVREADTIQIIVDRRADSEEMPEAPENTKIAYQNVTLSRNLNFANGVVSEQHVYIYNYLFQATETGTYEIGPFVLTVGGQRYRTQPFTIKVVKGSQRQNSQNYSDDFLAQFFGRQRSDFEPQGYLTASITSGPIRQNQPMVLDVTAYANDESILKSQIVEASPLSSQKILTYDVTSSATNAGVIEKFEKDGEDFYRCLLKRYVCFPIESGDIVIQPPLYVAFTSFRQMKLAVDQNVKINAEPVGQQGGLVYIGDLSVESKISTNVQDIGKVIELTIDITGNGNLKVFSNPYGNFNSPDLFVSAPVTKIEFAEKRGDKYYFKQSITYTLVAKRAGDIEIPPFKLEYYDDGMRRQSVTSGGYKLRITSEAAAGASIADMALKPLTPGRGFRFVMLTAPFLALFALSLLLPVAASIYGRHGKRMDSDANYARKFMAGKRFAKYFTEAKTCLAEKKYKEFYLALQKGLFYYITDKLGMPSGLGAREIVEGLRGKNYDEDTIEKFRQTYELCSRNAYSGRTDESAADETIERVRGVFEAIK